MNDQDSRLIDKFLRSQLTDSERKAFESKMDDSDFKDEVDFRKGLISVAERAGNEKFHQILAKESRKLDGKKPKKKKGSLYLLIALIALLGLFGLWTILNSSEESPEEIYMAHYEPFPNLIAPTERASTDNLTGVEKALSAYDNGEYSKAVSIFDTLSDGNEDVRMYHAISLMEEEQMHRAEQLLMSITASKTANFNQAAEWYLCLLYLKMGAQENYDSVKNKILQDQSHTYRGHVLNLD